MFVVWQDESVGNNDSLQGWRPKLDPWNSHSGRKVTPKRCPARHMNPMATQPHTHINKSKKQKRKVFIIQKIKINSLVNFQKEKKQTISHGKMGDHLFRVTICTKNIHAFWPISKNLSYRKILTVAKYHTHQEFLQLGLLKQNPISNLNYQLREVLQHIEVNIDTMKWRAINNTKE